MSDLPLLAIGFGLMPLGTLVFYALRDRILSHADIVWGFLVGALAFIGLAHAGAAVLTANSYLKYPASPLGSAGIAVAGFGFGVALWAVVLRISGPVAGRGERWILPALVAFVGLHSFGDGYVLGQSYAGVGAPGIELFPTSIAANILHRAVEGLLIVVPAIELAWRPSRTGVLLLAGLLTVPGAFLAPAFFAAPIPPTTQTGLYYGITVFESAAELAFAFLVIVLGIIPRLVPSTSRRWAVWAAFGLLALLLVHFAGE